MVRLSAVEEVGMLNESFFLYVEEVEFAARLRRSGHRVVCAVAANASQSTGGIPPYYEARNQVMLSNLHGRKGAVTLAVSRQGWRVAQELRHGKISEAGQRMKGLIDFYRNKKK